MRSLLDDRVRSIKHPTQGPKPQARTRCVTRIEEDDKKRPSPPQHPALGPSADARTIRILLWQPGKQNPQRGWARIGDFLLTAPELRSGHFADGVISHSASSRTPDPLCRSRVLNRY